MCDAEHKVARVPERERVMVRVRARVRVRVRERVVCGVMSCVMQNTRSREYQRMVSRANSTGVFMDSAYSTTTWNAVIAVAEDG